MENVGVSRRVRPALSKSLRLVGGLLVVGGWLATACGGRSLSSDRDGREPRADQLRDNPAGSTEDSFDSDPEAAEGSAPLANSAAEAPMAGVTPTQQSMSATQEPVEDAMQLAPQPEPACVIEAPRADNQTLFMRMARLYWGIDYALPDAPTMPEAFTDLDLSTDADVAEAARRLLADPRAKDGVVSFFRSWLQLTSGPEGLDFPEPLAGSAVESTRRTIDWLVFGMNAPLQSFYTGNRAVIDAALAEQYGVPGVFGWQPAELPPERSAGLLTQAHWLNQHPNLVRRGYVISAHLLCKELPPPPPTLVSVPPEPAEGLTTRELFEVHRQNRACAACHEWIDPLGFAFEHFDGLGQYRTLDQGKPIDASGTVPEFAFEYENLDGLLALLSDELQGNVQACALKHALQHASGRSSRPTDACLATYGEDLLRRSGGLSRDWIALVATTPLFTMQHEP